MTKPRDEAAHPDPACPVEAGAGDVGALLAEVDRLDMLTTSPAQFGACARTALPRLAAEVRRLRKKSVQAGEAVGEIVVHAMEKMSEATEAARLAQFEADCRAMCRWCSDAERSGAEARRLMDGEAWGHFVTRETGDLWCGHCDARKLREAEWRRRQEEG